MFINHWINLHHAYLKSWNYSYVVKGVPRYISNISYWNIYLATVWLFQSNINKQKKYYPCIDRVSYCLSFNFYVDLIFLFTSTSFAECFAQKQVCNHLKHRICMLLCLCKSKSVMHIKTFASVIFFIWRRSNKQI